MVIARSASSERYPLPRAQHIAGRVDTIGGDPGILQRPRRRHRKIGMQCEGDAVSGQRSEPDHLRGPLVPDAAARIDVTQLVDIIGLAETIAPRSAIRRACAAVEIPKCSIVKR